MQLSRVIMVALGALFAGYFVILALATLSVSRNPSMTLLAVGLYALSVSVCLVGALWRPRMPQLLGWLCLAAAAAYVLLGMSQLDPLAENGYATWFIGASGVQLTVLMCRGRSAVAWTGIVIDILLLWFWLPSFPAVLTSGVMGNIMWVLLAQLILRALRRAAQDATTLITAEREASRWQAAQEAMLQERMVRLQQTERMAMPMLQLIQQRQGRLDEDERQRCLVLEAGIRDEIRGRALLNDGVRLEVSRLRGAGIRVLLLDEGGLDALTETARERLLRQLGAVLAQLPGELGEGTEQLTIRTAPASGRSITLVGVRGVDLEDDEDVEVTLRHRLELSLETVLGEAAINEE